MVDAAHVGDVAQALEQRRPLRLVAAAPLLHQLQGRLPVAEGLPPGGGPPGGPPPPRPPRPAAPPPPPHQPQAPLPVAERLLPGVDPQGGLPRLAGVVDRL